MDFKLNDDNLVLKKCYNENINYKVFDVGNSDICYKLSTSRPDTIKKWQEECRLNRYKGAASGNVGYIFLCKAVDGMVETAPIQIPNRVQATRTPEQIAAEYGKPLEIAQKPLEIPDA